MRVWVVFCASAVLCAALASAATPTPAPKAHARGDRAGYLAFIVVVSLCLLCCCAVVAACAVAWAVFWYRERVRTRGALGRARMVTDAEPL